MSENSLKTADNFVQSVLFKNLRTFSVENESLADLTEDEINLRERYCASINRNLQESYGMSMNPELFYAFSKLPTDKQLEKYRQMSDVIDNTMGFSDFEAGHTFYVNFPEEVMSKSDYEIYRNAFFYYVGYFGLGIENSQDVLKEAGFMDKEKVKRDPLIEAFERETKYIGLSEPEKIHELMEDRMFGIGMSETKRQELFDYAKLFEKEFDGIVKKVSTSGSSFNSKENEAYVAAYLYSNGKKDLILKNGMLKDATDILRFISVISANNVARNGELGQNPAKLTTTKVFKVKLNKDDEIFVKTLMNKCKNIYVDVWQKEDFWKKVMRNIHAKKGPERVVRLFDKIYSKDITDEKGEPVDNVNQAFVKAKEAIKKGNSSLMEKFARTYKTAFMQKLANAYTVADPSVKGRFPDMIRSCHGIDPIQLIKTKNMLDLRNNDSSRTIRNSRGKLVALEREFVEIPESEKNVLKSAIDDAIKETVKNTKELGNVYIDESLYGIKVPKREDIKDSDGALYSSGTRLKSDKNKNLIALGVFWKEIGVDIDLHAVGIKKTKDGYRVDSIGWQCATGNKYAVFSGDLVTGDPFGDGKGAEEFIIIDKNKAKKEGVEYISGYIHNYNDVFENTESVRTIYMEKEGKLTRSDNVGGTGERPTFCGEVVEPSQFEQSLRITAAGRYVIPFIFDIKNESVIIVDEPGMLNDYGYNAVETINKISPAYAHAINSPSPTMGQLFEAYAAENGNIVKDISEADTVFVEKPVDRESLGIKEDAEIITAYDSERIVSEFALTQEKLPEKENEKDIVNDMNKEIHDLKEKLNKLQKEKEKLEKEQKAKKTTRASKKRGDNAR